MTEDLFAPLTAWAQAADTVMEADLELLTGLSGIRQRLLAGDLPSEDLARVAEYVDAAEVAPARLARSLREAAERVEGVLTRGPEDLASRLYVEGVTLGALAVHARLDAELLATRIEVEAAGSASGSHD